MGASFEKALYIFVLHEFLDLCEYAVVSKWVKLDRSLRKLSCCYNGVPVSTNSLWVKVKKWWKKMLWLCDVRVGLCYIYPSNDDFLSACYSTPHCKTTGEKSRFFRRLIESVNVIWHKMEGSDMPGDVYGNHVNVVFSMNQSVYLFLRFLQPFVTWWAHHNKSSTCLSTAVGVTNTSASKYYSIYGYVFISSIFTDSSWSGLNGN